jgi:hypothetical protein
MNTIKLLFIAFFFIAVLYSNAHSQPTTWLKPFEEWGNLFKVQQTYDGNYIAVGRDLSFYNKIFLVKVNNFGDTLWTRRLGNPDYGYDGFWIENLSNNGNIITGGTTEGVNVDAYLLETDINGYYVWDRLYGKDNFEVGHCVKPTIDGGYVLLCRNAYPTTSDFLLIKTDSSGNIQWQKNYDSGLTSHLPSEIDLVGGGYIFVGSSAIIQQTSFAWLLRLNENGDTLWSKKYNNNMQLGTVGVGVQTVTTIGHEGFIILGRTRNSFNREISYVVKTDTSGSIEWDRTYSSFREDYPYSIREIPGKGYVFCGTTDSAQVIFKSFIRVIDYEGNLIHEKFYTVPGGDYTDFRSVEVSSDGGFILCGIYKYPGQFGKILMAKTDSAGNIGPVSVNQISSGVPSDFKLYQNYPNPFNPGTVISYSLKVNSEITLKVFDMLGKEISILVKERQDAGTYSVDWDGSNFSSGVYFYQLIAKDQFNKIMHSSTRRMLLIK